MAARQIGIVHQDQFAEVKLICESLSFGLVENPLIVVISVNNRNGMYTCINSIHSLDFHCFSHGRLPFECMCPFEYVYLFTDVCVCVYTSVLCSVCHSSYVAFPSSLPTAWPVAQGLGL